MNELILVLFGGFAENLARSLNDVDKDIQIATEDYDYDSDSDLDEAEINERFSQERVPNMQFHTTETFSEKADSSGPVEDTQGGPKQDQFQSQPDVRGRTIFIRDMAFKT